MNLKRKIKKNSEDDPQKIDINLLPDPIKKRLRGYIIAAVILILMGFGAWLIMGSLAGLGFGVVLGLTFLLMRFIQIKKIEKTGYVIWCFKVMEHTYVIKAQERFNGSPSGFNAKAMDGPYKGEIFYIPITSQTFTPPEGSLIDICVPADVTASPIRDRMFLSSFYGFTLVNNDDSEE